MARKPPPIETRIKKGEVRNPLGARAHNPALRALKALTEPEFIEIGSLVLKGSGPELRKISRDITETVLRRGLAKMALNFLKTGDPKTLDAFLNRLIGKPKESIHVTGVGDAPQVHIYLPDNTRAPKAIDSSVVEVQPVLDLPKKGG